jgi:thiamine-phosphate pyrophosphorylase
VIRVHITGGSASPGCFDPVLNAVRNSVANGVEFIQIREKQLPSRDLASLVQACTGLRGASQIIVNTRVDVALACGAQGAHLPADSPGPALWRRICPPGFLFSVACHSLADVIRAADEGADLALFAPVFDPLSKPSAGPPAGLAMLGEAAASVRIPVIALGGITPVRIALCLAEGAAGVAGISLFQPGGPASRAESGSEDRP